MHAPVLSTQHFARRANCICVVESEMSVVLRTEYEVLRT